MTFLHCDLLHKTVSPTLIPFAASLSAAGLLRASKSGLSKMQCTSQSPWALHSLAAATKGSFGAATADYCLLRTSHKNRRTVMRRLLPLLIAIAGAAIDGDFLELDLSAAAAACEALPVGVTSLPAGTSLAGLHPAVGTLAELTTACEGPVGDPRPAAAARLSACLLARKLLPVDSVRSAAGGRLLYTAAARKHFRLAAALASAGAPLGFSAPTQAGFSVLHASLATDLVALDNVQKLLQERASGCGSGRAPPPQAVSLFRTAATMMAHLPPKAAEGVVAALSRLFPPPSSADASAAVRGLLANLRANSGDGSTGSWPTWVASACSRTVAVADARLLANALSALLSRVLTGTAAARMRAALAQASAVCGTAACNGGGTCDDNDCAAAAAPALQAAATTLHLFSAVDARGRTSLHIAAATSNAHALAELAAGALAAANETLAAAAALDGSSLASAERAAIAALQRLLAARDVFGRTAAETARLVGENSGAVALEALAASGARFLGDGAVAAPPPLPHRDPLAPAPRPAGGRGGATPTVAPAAPHDGGGWDASEATLAAKLPAIVRAAMRNAALAGGGADCGIANVELVASGAEDAAAGRLTAQQFAEKHVATGLPAMLRAHAAAWRIRAVLTRDALLGRFGDLDFPVAAVPYARSFGGAAHRARLRDFAASALLLAPGGPLTAGAAGGGDDDGGGGNSTPAAPEYIFDAPGRTTATAAVDAHGEVAALTAAAAAAGPRWAADAVAVELLRSLSLVPDVLRGRVPLAEPLAAGTAALPTPRDGHALAAQLRAVVEEAASPAGGAGGAAATAAASPLVLCETAPCSEAAPPPKPQFFLGPPGSGAPMHMHKDAINILAHGEKRWLLLPPKDALYSSEPVSEWLAAGRAPSNATVCTQRAGDVLFVPRGWAHAVLNTKTSVGFAIEFSAATGLPM